MFYVLFLMMPRLLKLLSVIFAFTLFYCVVGVHVFAADYSGTYAEEHSQSKIMIGAFNNSPRAFVQMFVLLTTENYPDFMEPAWNDSQATFVYFFSYMYLGVIFMMSVLLALTVSFYMEYTEKQVGSERKKEWKGLVKAFSIIDVNGKSFLCL
jgi:hypothetical protein